MVLLFPLHIIDLCLPFIDSVEVIRYKNVQTISLFISPGLATSC